MSRPAYPSDLTDAQWARIRPLLPPPKPGGRARSVNLREIINGIVYLQRTGCPLRMLPHDLPPWGTVHYYYRRYRLEGIWPQIHNLLAQNGHASDGSKHNGDLSEADQSDVA